MNSAVRNVITKTHAKGKDIWLSACRWGQINQKITELLEQGKKTFYLYPKCSSAAKICKIIRKNDNAIVKILGSMSELETGKEPWEDDTVFLITSGGKEYYNKIRRNVYRCVPREKVEDMFPDNPEARADKRAAQAAAYAREVYEMGIDGAVAEAGVYKGDFSKIINKLFPDRKLYLFDTFEGFTKDMIHEEDDSMEAGIFIDKLKDTSVELVLGKMTFPENCIVRKGLFPQTAEGIEDRFCFVSLDMDLYEPVYAGLVYFWEKLVPGGCIFVHDYYWFEGIHRAVHKFCKENGAAYYNVTDGNTAVVVKPVYGVTV